MTARMMDCAKGCSAIVTWSAMALSVRAVAPRVGTPTPDLHKTRHKALAVKRSTKHSEATV